MDAKPQKPIRGFRVHGDENALPVIPGNKTLHSRNKSSPALSTMATAGMNKAPLKRTAFGDVSNTAQGNRLVRDDSNLPSKSNVAEIIKEKPTQVQKEDVKASAALLRPAYRPSTNEASLKPATLVNQATAPSQKPILEAAYKPNARKTLSKKNTTVFKDYTTDPYPQQEVETSKTSGYVQHNAVRKSSLPTTTSDQVPLPAQIRKAQSTYNFTLKDHQDSNLDHVGPHAGPALRPTGSGDVKPSQSRLDIDSAPQADEKAGQGKDSHVASLHTKAEASVSVHEANYVPEGPYYAPPAPHPSSLEIATTTHEPEEYWYEDDEEDNYEEEGYVTARSCRSRGEVTGNATQTLVPRTNNKARRELDIAKKIVESMRTAEELDDELWDTTMVAEYGEEIFDYMHDLEDKYKPNPHYMDLQTEIQWSMRSVLMDWLVQVHLRFQLLPETLFLCVNYIDRFLSYKVVSLGKLQLVGATAIFVAAKYEEINCPSVSEIVYMVDGGYTVDEILKAERFMLSMLQFELGWPGPMSFLRRISKADDYDLETRTLAKYFLEITIMDERFLGCPPSFTAAGAHCLARLMLQKGSWSHHHVYFSGYTYTQLYPLLKLMYECCEDPVKHHGAIFDKYQDKRYKCASRFVATEVRKGFQVPGVQSSTSDNLLSLGPLPQVASFDSPSWSSERPLY